MIPYQNFYISKRMGRTQFFVSGFTLIELLVVIAIIGVLSAIVLTSVNRVRMKSRDARRVADMRTIQTALELYFSDYGRYPSHNSDASQAPGSSITCDTWDCSNQLAQSDPTCTNDPNPCEGAQFLSVLIPKYLAAPVVDPLNKGDYYYRYARILYPNGSGPNCLMGTRTRYLLQIRRFENGINTYKSPEFCYPPSGTAHWSGGRFE